MSVVVVTGASGGIGRAAAREFGARGDAVALLARGALDRMRPRNRGAIVQVAPRWPTAAFLYSPPTVPPSTRSKGCTTSLRAELLHEGSAVHTTMVQLPAVNTPQFDWVLSRLPHKAQPVPPIYQPEVAARAIVHAADHPERREYWVGGSTVATLVANKLASARDVPVTNRAAAGVFRYRW